MDEYARRRLPRPRCRPLCLEPLEGRFLPAALAPLPDPPTAPHADSQPRADPPPGYAQQQPAPPDQGAVIPAAAGHDSDGQPYADNDSVPDDYDQLLRVFQAAMDQGMTSVCGTAGPSAGSAAASALPCPAPQAPANPGPPPALFGPGILSPAVTGIGAERPLVAPPSLPAPAPERAVPEVAPPPSAGMPDGRIDGPEVRAEGAPPPPAAGREVVDRTPPIMGPLAGVVPFDLGSLRRGVDEFFARLGRLGEGWAGRRLALETASWLTVAAAVALEFARLRQRQSAAAPLAEDGPLPGLPALRPGGDA